MSAEKPIDADYVIAGAGCAGLSLAMNLKREGLPFQRVLIIESAEKNNNDRTWCFWSKDTGAWYQPLVYRSWTNFAFLSPGYASSLALKPYRYELIRGLDFYSYCRRELSLDPRFEFVSGTVQEMRSTAEGAELRTSTQLFRSKLVFNSVTRHVNKQARHVNYVQHFKGWLVETDLPVFDPELPVFMDFSKALNGACEFFYVIPHSSNRALVEFTGFSPARYPEEQYQQALQDYVREKTKGATYRILEEENGDIPMFESDFTNPYGPFVVNIGSAGGASKQSTGYTFYFIQKHCQQIIEHLRAHSLPVAYKRPRRFKWYDTLFMRVMDQRWVSAPDLFHTIMTKNDVRHTLAFLNEESSFAAEWRIMRSVKPIPFLRAALQKLFRR